MRVIAKRLIKEGKSEELVRIYEQLVTLTRKEDGCVSYGLYRSQDDPRLFAVMEEWKDQASLDAHMQTEHFKTLVPKLNELTEVRYDMEKYDTVI
jgi:quinol monooxygenase YgiN